ncbi:MAG TPA: aldo/keto reductase [Mycobacteriales bacterium]|nr:aldo/keto reductase [Mycobacteriales bacterium]
MGDLRYRRLGDSGLVVSVVGLGCNNFRARCSDDDAFATIDAAIDAGVTLFDTADIYGNKGGSEELIGEALAKNGRRDDVVLATKFGMDMGGPPHEARASRHYIRKAVRASLRRLQVDHIDLYQLHEPDPLTPIEETLAALDELVKEGLVRYVGSSNLAGWQIVDADWVAQTAGLERFISAQNQYSLLERDVEAEVVPACEHTGVGLLPYFPLANGLLTGKYRRGAPPAQGTRLGNNPQRASDVLTDGNLDRVEALTAYAEGVGASLLDLAIGGLAALPAVASVIAGATKAEQVRANVAAGAWTPTDEDLGAIDGIVPARR